MFSGNSIRRIFKKAGASRVSKDAIKGLKKEAERYSYLIARKAVKNSQYLGRKGVRLEDIKEVIEINESSEEGNSWEI